ncbi:MAG: cell wall hydrolase [Eubacteriales bacterium]|nr:cell wall hydrolase [Eubacteriales bacterium]
MLKIQRMLAVIGAALAISFVPGIRANAMTPQETEFVSIAEEGVRQAQQFNVSEEEIELIALVTMAEAEGECEYGKRLVIDTILNRVDSVYFPDTIYDVIYQKNQFSSMWNGRVKRVRATEEVKKLVREELIFRTDTEVTFFTAGRYGRYGIPMFQIGGHYFSKY